MCQTTTSAVTFMYQNLGYSCTNYIDDFGGAETPTKSAAAFQALGDLLRCLGLSTSPDKDSPLATSMVFLGVLVDTTNMTVSVGRDRLSELQSHCTSLLSVMHVSRHDLQSLLGVMSFVTSCVRPARVFMSSLLYTLQTYRFSKYCPLSSVNHSDLHWWCHFLPSYNGVSLIKTSPWLDNRLFLSTDACCTGAGGYFTGQYFHTPFPAPILSQFGHDINILELLTIMVALKLWGKLLRSQRLILQCNNANSVLAINSGHSRVPGMHLCLREIWFLTARHDIDLFTRHIAGVDNTIADHLSRWHLSPVHHLRFDALTADTPTTYILNIKFTTSGCFLRIKWSKTRQHKEGIRIVSLPSIPHSPLCPVTAIHHYFSLVPASPDDPFFCFPTATGLTPVTASFFATTLKKLLGKLGLAPTHYSPHSFRRGGATFAFQAGAPEHLLQLHGDWRSDAYKQYLTLPLCAHSLVADIMAAGLFSYNC